MWIGSKLLISSSTEIARAIGVSDRVIAISLVAIGTSLPELFASVYAAFKNETKLAIGNLLGSNLPTINIQSKKINEKINIVDLVLLSNLENSKSEIRRLVKGNAVKINNNIISDDKFEINKDLFKDNYLKLSLGKKRHIKIELN